MKRDMELVRQILVEMEKAPYDGTPNTVRVEGYADNIVNYHLLLMGEADLIGVYVAQREQIAPVCRPIRLTWQGHEFLDAARNETIWRKALDHVGRTTGTVAFEVFKGLLTTYAQQALGAPIAGGV